MNSRAVFPLDIVKAVKACDFSKGLGPDMFDGQLLSDEKVLANMSELFKQALNHNVMPAYLKESRMVLLSKTGRQETTLDDIRPIAVTNHLTKVIEKAIKIKIEEMES